MFKRIINRIPVATIKQYSIKEEVVHSVIHGLGILFGIIGTTVLMVLSGLFGNPAHLICYLLYGLSLIALYTSSTLYHALPFTRAKSFLKICDHSAIYLLIAGTYTPFLILNIKGVVGFTLLAVVWGLALLGIIFKLFFAGRFKVLSTILYLGMGWIAIFAVNPLMSSLTYTGLAWILAGGLTYTLGTIFYLMKRIPYTHAIWHMFVLCGSVFHYIAIIYSSNLNFL